MTTVPMEPVAAPEPRWRALRGTNVADRLYRTVLTTLALVLPLLLLALVGELVVSAWPAIQRFGGTFLWTSVWDPVAGIYGDVHRKGPPKRWIAGQALTTSSPTRASSSSGR